MLCSHCGAHLMDDETVCSRCGARREPEVPVDKKGRPMPTKEEIERKKDRRADIFLRIILPIVGSTLSIAAFCLILWMGYNFLKDYSANVDSVGETQSISENGLFRAVDIENNLNTAYIKANVKIDGDYPGVSRFAMEDAAELTHDQTFSCVVVAGENGTAVDAEGMIKEGQVVQLQTVVRSKPESYGQMDEAEQAATMTFAVFPVSIFRKDIMTSADFSAFIDSMALVSAENAPVEKRRIVEDNIEYTYMCGEREGVMVSSFTARYLPGFAGGFLEEGGQLPTIPTQSE